MTRALLSLALLSALGCRAEPTFSGTAVGNPGAGLTVRIAPDAGVGIDAAEAPDATVRLTRCAGGGQSLGAARTLDLLGPAEALPLPAGTWCGVTLLTGAPLSLAGEVADTTFDARLTLDAVVTTSGLSFTTTPTDRVVLLLGGPGWPPSPTLQAEGPGAVTIDQGTASHDALVTGLRSGSVSFRDDGDGALGADDDVLSASTPAAWGLPDPEEEEDTDE